MAHNDTVVAIDVGTTKVCTIIGRRSGKSHVETLSYSSKEHSGLTKGVVSDVEETKRAIRASVDAVEAATDHSVSSAVVSVSGSHLQFENGFEQLQVSNSRGVVASDNLARDAETLRKCMESPGRRLIHAKPFSYTLDGATGILNPIGMHCKEMQAETHYVTASQEKLDLLISAVEGAGVKVEAVTLGAVASGLSTLTPQERKSGAILVDIGGGTTDITAFKGGRAYYTGVIPVGGAHFTSDIAHRCSSTFEDAEAVKIECASAEFQPAGAAEYVSVPVVGRDNELRVTRMEICQLARERAQELAGLINFKLSNERTEEADDSVIVLTGGASRLPGLADLISKHAGIRVRMGAPNLGGPTAEDTQDPAFSTSVGMLIWGLTEYQPGDVASVTWSARRREAPAPESNGAQAEVSDGFINEMRRRMGDFTTTLFSTPRKGRD